MRILELINTLEQGGAEQMISTLAIELCARGHVVHLACIREPGFMPVPLQRLNEAGVHFVAFNKGDGFSVKAVRDLAAYIRENRIEIVHSHNPPVGHYGVAAGWLGHAAAVVNTVHGTATLRLPLWARCLFWASCLAGDRVVSVCRAVDEVTRKRYPGPRSKFAVVYNGIELDALLSLMPRHSDDEIVFGTMARLVPVKDHASLLRAFGEVRKSHSRCRLEILGDGELRASLEQLSDDLGLRQAVTFLGWDSNIERFLSRIHIFVLSSLSEGLPLTVLEAMAAGLPVVATSVGGVTEVIRDAACGWLCEPGNTPALARSMCEAIMAPDRTDRGLRARDSAIQKFSVRAMADGYEQLFEELTGRKQPALLGQDLNSPTIQPSRSGRSITTSDS